MQELNGKTIVDIPIIESMIHNRRCVSSLINGAKQSAKKQETQGTTLGIQVMEDKNHIKTDVVKQIRDKQKREISKMITNQHCTQSGEEHNICNDMELLWS